MSEIDPTEAAAVRGDTPVILESVPRGVPVEPRVHFQVVIAPREVDLEALASWAEELVATLAPRTEGFVVRFTHDEEMARLNRTFRNRPEATDVLSFPGETSPAGSHLGDVVIAVPVAERQAADLGSTVTCELKRLVLHAVLHCLGYDHETDDGEMDRLEQRLRTQWVPEEVR